MRPACGEVSVKADLVVGLQVPQQFLLLLIAERSGRLGPGDRLRRAEHGLIHWIPPWCCWVVTLVKLAVMLWNSPASPA
jgi:hypothetical protein